MKKLFELFSLVSVRRRTSTSDRGHGPAGTVRTCKACGKRETVAEAAAAEREAAQGSTTRASPNWNWCAAV
ncbi:unnamed protein product [Nesidiocoris tenuis]|uniref:Uncharacterized protein n=1 Tax=Nesidiocoris tenuis TaxID=355587 RepID=A0A6H5GPY9_9HEMI|nr:unnamed protein product [Nesidiocoris tenuis]